MNFILYLIIPINLIFEILTETVFEQGGVIAYLRGAIFYSIAIAYITFGNFKLNNASRYILIYILFISIQVTFSSELYVSMKESSKILLSMLMFPLGYYSVNNWNRLAWLNKSVILTIWIFIGNYIVSQYFNIGLSFYTKSQDFIMGNLEDRWNNVTYLLLVLPVVALTTRRKKIIVLMAATLLIFLVIGLKRIAILTTFIGIVYYIFVLYKPTLKNILASLSLGLIFFGVLAMNTSLIEGRIDARGSKIGSDIVQVISEETRFKETVSVWSEVISMDDPIKSWFGLEGFNTVGNYGDGEFFDSRRIHVDYNSIVNTTGIVGLLMYFIIFYLIYREKRSIKKRLGKLSNNHKVLLAVFTVLFFSQFITSFGGQMYSVTFRSIIFIYLGAILGVLNYEASRFELKK